MRDIFYVRIVFDFFGLIQEQFFFRLLILIDNKPYI